jgi:hypothetical protein
MSDDVIHTSQNKFLEGGFPLDRHKLGALKQVIWEINRSFHKARNTAMRLAGRDTRVLRGVYIAPSDESMGNVLTTCLRICKRSLQL